MDNGDVDFEKRIRSMKSYWEKQLEKYDKKLDSTNSPIWETKEAWKIYLNAVRTCNKLLNIDINDGINSEEYGKNSKEKDDKTSIKEVVKGYKKWRDKEED